MANDISRRTLLKGTAATVVGLAAGPAKAMAAATAAQPTVARTTVLADSRLRFGIIACGGKGWSGMQAAAEHGDIVALCDVDVNNRTKAMLEYPHAAAFNDYRDLLTMMEGRIDAVVISTPDHHHAPATVRALRQGLHCYTEKPLARTIWEVRQMGKIAHDKKLATQMGNQSTASTAMRKIAALVQKGEFGPVKEVHLWTDRAAGWWKQGVPRPEVAICPRTLDFDIWLGPRPDRPFGEGYHPFSWRGWWDFGTGALGDMGCHIFNMAHMALDLREPATVQAQTSGHNKDSFPEWAIVHYEFPKKGARPPFTVTWYDGGKRPDPALAPGFEIGGNGVIMVCEGATIFSPNEGNTEFHLVGGAPIPDIQVDESPGHMAEFARAAKGGQPARSNFPDYASPLAECVLLGNLAVWADGPKLEWDSHKMAVKGTKEFDGLIRPTFKKGWEV